jgi:hypothetical protein
MDVASERRETNGEGGVAMFHVLIMLNNWLMSSFVAQVASVCTRSLASRFWSHSASIAVEVANFCECGGSRAGGGGCH